MSRLPYEHALVGIFTDMAGFTASSAPPSGFSATMVDRKGATSSPFRTAVQPV
jgi:hypothetical protein